MEIFYRQISLQRDVKLIMVLEEQLLWVGMASESAK